MNSTAVPIETSIGTVDFALAIHADIDAVLAIFDAAAHSPDSSVGDCRDSFSSLCE
jgi:hypothetical protein